MDGETPSLGVSPERRVFECSRVHYLVKPRSNCIRLVAVEGVAVEGVACSVVAAGGAGVGVTGGSWTSSRGDAGFSGAGDEGHPQGVEADLLALAKAARWGRPR
jgi:hypothetical protein